MKIKSGDVNGRGENQRVMVALPRSAVFIRMTACSKGASRSSHKEAKRDLSASGTRPGVLTYLTPEWINILASHKKLKMQVRGSGIAGLTYQP